MAITNKKAFKKPLNNRFKIKITKNGPYIVYGGIPLRVNTVVLDASGIPYRWRPGKKYPVEKTYKLCRCGKSNNKPFCDNIHEQIEFDDTETASRQPYLEQAKIMKGPGLTLTDLPNLCVHAGFCDRSGGIWTLTEYSDEPEAREIAIEEAANCPSGRLIVWDKEGNLIEPEFEPSIELVEDPFAGLNGPFWVHGGIPIESADGTTYEIRNRVTLCRCGKSENKPFCDGIHLKK
ncbi:MAG: CDGSH iron-sulfur domain-containing protein [Chloroflexi bacterium]|nr:CDGSH iron-sulfur domain-containing protein [Chloroflexota bacterium]